MIRRTGLWVCIALAVFALILVFDPLPFRSPAAAPTTVPSWVTDTTPVRRPSSTPTYQAGVFTYDCNDCHGILPAPPSHAIRTAVQHQECVLKHGINTWCLSCHHPNNRDAFVDDRGAEIPWSQPQLLCAKCHGPVYRDWQHGAHGRTNGYWDKTQGEQTRRTCTECHDPHQPPFPPMHPAPGPNTLRMGPQGDEGQGDVHNPLKAYQHTGSEHQHAARIEEGH